MTKRFLILVLLSACTAGPLEPVQITSSRSVLDDHARRLMWQRPVRASRLGLETEFMGASYQHLIGDYGPAGFELWRLTLAEITADLSALYGADVDDQILDILTDAYDRYGGAVDIPYGYVDSSGRHRPYIINQIRHPLRSVTSSLTDFVDIASEADAEAYIVRLQGLSHLCEQVLSKFELDLAAGWAAPVELRRKAIRWLRGFVEMPAAAHPLVTSFSRRLGNLSELPEERRLQLLADAAEVLNTEVYPSFEIVTAGVKASLDFDPAGDGVWALPMGDEFYRHAVFREAASDLHPEEIHQIGLREVERIIAEMDVLLKSLGRDQGSVGQRLNALSAEPEQLYEDSPEGRAQLLVDISGMVGEISRFLPEYFSVLPTQGVQIRAYPELVQDSSVGGSYAHPSLDGARPGTYTINLRSMNERARFTLKTLTYHETLPGHHLQIAVTMNQGDQPLLQRIQSVSAFAEGWAMYAEFLAVEMGMYEDDPLGDLGRLQAELWRAARLVMDTGLHFKQWSRERTIEYGMQVNGRPEVTVTAEVERFMAWPGQALSYKLGMLAIMDLREEAQAQLRQKFDLREFHDLLTTGGAMTMPRLRERVLAWVEQKKGRS